MANLHGNVKREKRRRLGERCEVKAYVAQPRLVEIAHERTEGMAAYFMLASRGREYYRADLETLVRSAYMQGVNDILEAIARHGHSEEQP